MKHTFLILLMGCSLHAAIAQKCDIAQTGIAIYNVSNSQPVASVSRGSNVNFRFSIGNFGTDAGCIIPANTVTAVFDFPTLAGGVKPYIYDGPASFTTGYFTWTYNPVNDVLNGVNTAAITNGTGDLNILVKVKGNEAATGISHLTLNQNGGISDNASNNYSGSQLIVTDNPILPIKLSSFTILADKCDALLSWSTVSETATFSHFDIEYSQDAITFIRIGNIASQNNANGASYNFRYNQLSGNGYYRLRQVDKNGSAEYSSVVRVTTACKDKSRVLVYPNPVKFDQKLYVNVSGYTGKISGELYNAIGQKVSVYNLANSSNELSLSELSAGAYTLYVRGDGGGVETFKIVVTR